MKLNYYPETDSLYIDLADEPGVEAREIAPGLVVDFNKEGRPVGIDIEHASSIVNLTTVETVSLPVAADPSHAYSELPQNARLRQ